MDLRLMEAFRQHLLSQEKRPATREKYLRDVRNYVNFLGDQEVSLSVNLAYKQYLEEQYARQRGIQKGPIFTTKTGQPLNRSNIWREMKALCALAGVSAEKVYPHNLRHLFARTFYALEKDIAKLADVLGHSNINTTRIYIISTGAEHRRKLERMHLLV